MARLSAKVNEGKQGLRLAGICAAIVLACALGGCGGGKRPAHPSGGASEAPTPAAVSSSSTVATLRPSPPSVVLGSRVALLRQPDVTGYYPPSYRAGTQLPLTGHLYLTGAYGAACTLTGAAYHAGNFGAAGLSRLRARAGQLAGTDIVGEFVVDGPDGTTGVGITLSLHGVQDREVELHHGDAALAVECDAPVSSFAAEDKLFVPFIASLSIQ
ncbi:MAG TPA: hypothetical protein VHX88_02100 [Solirubrobacteraceae bacterium]|jgi:hypothetical protein|nr:hypothetical protein [Solirubrobacteraceae bacterium]